MTRPLPTIAANGNAKPTRKAYRLAAQALDLLDEIEKVTRRCGETHDDAKAARSAVLRLKVAIGARLAEDAWARTDAKIARRS